jgi:23S rRNA (adenine2503-C2)-methyltransferase
MPRLLNELTPAELQSLIPEATDAEARRLFVGVHAPGCAERLSELPGVRRAVLARAQAEPIGRLEIVDRRRAADGFVKYLFRSPLGGELEAVRIPIFDTKYVVCVSSQIGCALGCAFCATGRLGFQRNLAAWELVEQVRAIRDEADRPVRSVVFMGMGEPLLNYDNVIRAAKLLSIPGGIQIGRRNVTISTSGVVPAIRRYTREGHPYRLAFSVNAATQEQRVELMPISRTHPLPELIEAIGEYAANRRERAMIAYVMIAGENTRREDAEALRAAFEGIPIKLDLIDVADPRGVFLPPGREELDRFRDALQILRSPIARRYSGGREICAACGTLAATRTGGSELPPP